MKPLQIGVQAAYGTAGSPFGTETALQLASGANTVLPKGLYQVITGPNDKVQYSPDAGVTWRDYQGVNQGGLIVSDGFNARVLNTGVADLGATVTRYSQVYSTAN